MFLVFLGSFSIIFDIFDLCILKFVLKQNSCCFNENFWKPVFGPQTANFNFNFSKRSTRISNDRPRICAIWGSGGGRPCDPEGKPCDPEGRTLGSPNPSDACQTMDKQKPKTFMAHEWSVMVQ